VSHAALIDVYISGLNLATVSIVADGRRRMRAHTSFKPKRPQFRGSGGLRPLLCRLGNGVSAPARNATLEESFPQRSTAKVSPYPKFSCLRVEPKAYVHFYTLLGRGRGSIMVCICARVADDPGH
jgi:hypothetical protein